MKHLASFTSVALFFALIFVSGYRISRNDELNALYLSISLLFLAQGILWLGGEISPGKPGRLGLWRATAMTIFIVQIITIPFALFQFIWREIGKVAPDEVGFLSKYQLFWALSGGIFAALLIAIARVRWWRKADQPTG